MNYAQNKAAVLSTAILLLLGITILPAQSPCPTKRSQSVSISDGKNDVEIGELRGHYDDSSDLELVDDNGRNGNGPDQLVGLRFTGIEVPANATLQEAYIQFTTDEENSDPTNLTIKLEVSPTNASIFDSKSEVSPNYISQQVEWKNIPAWNTRGEKGVNQRTPNLSTLIQQVISYGSWDSDRTLTFWISGNGCRTAESFEGGADKGQAPTLVLKWTEPCKESDGIAKGPGKFGIWGVGNKRRELFMNEHIKTVDPSKLTSNDRWQLIEVENNNFVIKSPTRGYLFVGILSGKHYLLGYRQDQKTSARFKIVAAHKGNDEGFKSFQWVKKSNFFLGVWRDQVVVRGAAGDATSWTME